MESTIAISPILCNILIASFSLVMLAWASVGIQTLINDFREEKRKEKKETQDNEYTCRIFQRFKGTSFYDWRIVSRE